MYELLVLSFGRLCVEFVSAYQAARLLCTQDNTNNEVSLTENTTFWTANPLFQDYQNNEGVYEVHKTQKTTNL